MEKPDKKEKEKELQKIISLTFDEKAETRKQAAFALAGSDEPAALFALFELSYDKDDSVKLTAREILSKKPPVDKNTISFAEIFSQSTEKEAPEVSVSLEEDEKKRKLLSPIARIFEKKFGKAKAGLVRERMMPTIEKIYLKAIESKPEEYEKREKSMQKMLTSYVDVLSGLDRLMHEDKTNIIKVQSIPEANEIEKKDEGVLEEVGVKIDASKIAQELSELSEEEEIKEKTKTSESDKTIFRKAYELMMASDGDEEFMHQQSKNLIKQLEEEVILAFKMAKQRFKAENIAHLTEIRDGMRNVNTSVLTVKDVYIGEYPRTKTKKDTYARIIVNDDEGSEGLIYLFEGRGKEVQPGMKIKVEKGQVKTFVFSGETAISIGKKGNVYIVL